MSYKDWPNEHLLNLLIKGKTASILKKLTPNDGDISIENIKKEILRRLGDKLKPVYYEDEKYKRFVVFRYERYYASGGVGDIAFDSDSLIDALKWVKGQEEKDDFIELCDLQNGLKEINVKETLNGRTQT